MKKPILFLAAFLLVIACQKNNSIEKHLIKKADWLIGNWQYKTSSGTLSENWQKVNDSTFKAQSLFIKDKDTIHNENIILQQNGEELSYSTTIKGQNNNKPIRFVFNKEIENELLFENPKNDYPQKISYKKGSNSIITQISGIQSGKNTTEKYNMIKTK